jgi:hypothetical protein
VPNIDGSIPNPMRGELIKASNGMIYGVTQNFSSCVVGMPFLGAIVRLNPANNNFTFIYPFNCTPNDGKSPSGSLIEATPGKLYGTTWRGGSVAGSNTAADDGVLFVYDIAANTYTKKLSFNHLTIGAYPGPLTLADNGKLYGVLSTGGHDPENPGQEVKGTLYEYDITANTIVVRHYFKMIENDYPTGQTPLANTLLKSSDGYLYGVNSRGVFRFDPSNDDIESNVTTPGPALEFGNLYGDLIEVCRKPSYIYIENDTYTICDGESFAFDIQNTNATGYTWKKDNVTIGSQTAGILNLSNLQIADSGDYTCEMMNECGITVTMPIHLTIEACMGLDKAAGFKNAISLYPNPAERTIAIKLPENPEFSIKNISIFNMLGQQVYSVTSAITDINITDFAQGMYIIKMETDQGDWQSKFIKK